MSITAAFLVSIELALIHLMDTFDFFKCNWALAKRTTRINHQPLLNTLSVEIVTDVAGQRCHQRVFIIVNKADHAWILIFKDICVVLDSKELAHQPFAHIQPFILLKSICKHGINRDWNTHQADCSEKGGQEGRKDTENDNYLVVNFKNAGFFVLTAILWV